MIIALTTILVVVTFIQVVVEKDWEPALGLIITATALNLIYMPLPLVATVLLNTIILLVVVVYRSVYSLTPRQQEVAKRDFSNW